VNALCELQSPFTTQTAQCGHFFRIQGTLLDAESVSAASHKSHCPRPLEVRTLSPALLDGSGASAAIRIPAAYCCTFWGTLLAGPPLLKS